MISDSKYVKSVDSNAPKKGWVITWQDDKKDFIFEEAWLKLLSKAQEEQRLVNFTKEQNAKGYWNIQTLVLAELPDTPSTPPQSKSEPPTPVSNGNVPPREHDIHKQVAYKGVMESCSTGIFPWEKRWEIVLIDTDVLDGKLSPKDADSKTISIVTSMTK